MTLIISTYNRPEALEVVLISILKQTVFPDEIIIADDGSTNETKELLKKYQLLFKINIIHCWQEDQGFKLSQIRNKAIAQAKGDYIILIDGDIVLEKHFIADHIKNAVPGYFIQGSRVMLSPELTAKIIEEKNFSINFMSAGITNRFNTIRNRLLSGLMLNTLSDKFKSIKGCNMAFWKTDIIKVNGYNEDFIGWGSEDKEMAVRFYNSFIFGKKLKFAALGYHLYHPINLDIELFENNNRILEQAKTTKSTFCQNGIDKYLK